MINKEELKELILQELDDTEYAFHVYPHVGLHPDYFLRYWHLWGMCYEYFNEVKPPYSPPDLCQ